ncbi:hypothetical protein BO99DRAFT_455428 [Aspergillus violaceofuscus CBS 115571]|uniref:Uncharacterized protein n=1 Tax=Aspergillus violaceofuscus (strain CBS 115571) TaxID=1450538 RepID=A0A2V5HPB0_ASPV1|nr:hypothetical protein BO99DRAFT_455428 [Aspergillus violaceofuscus CBS 115571]
MYRKRSSEVMSLDHRSTTMTDAPKTWKDLLRDHFFVDLWVPKKTTFWGPEIHSALQAAVNGMTRDYIWGIESKAPSPDHVLVRVILPGCYATQTPIDILTLLNDWLDLMDDWLEPDELRWTPETLVEGEFECLRVEGLQFWKLKGNRSVL